MKKELNFSPTFCVYPWMAFKLGPDKNTKLCCHATQTFRSNTTNKTYPIDKFTLDEIWNSEGMRTVRNKMLSGTKIDACNNCYYQQYTGNISYRETYNDMWLKSSFGKEIVRRILKSKKNNYIVDSSPLFMEINFGNLCNLKCRMCNPENSSLLYQEQKELLSKKRNIKSLAKEDISKYKNEFFNWNGTSKETLNVWDTIYKWSPKVKALHFKGGEPMLNKQTWELIDFFQLKGYSKTVSLVFNTNCTYIPKKLLNTFDNFAHVNINCSIDGIKDIQEYIRYPSKWNIIEKNIIKMLKLKNENKNIKVNVNYTIQVYNILYLTQFLKWVDSLRSKYGKINVGFELCTYPHFLDIAILPQKVRKFSLQSLENYQSNNNKQNTYITRYLYSIKNILRNIKKNDSLFQLERFFEYTFLLDKKRGNNFKKSLPELYELLSNL